MYTDESFFEKIKPYVLEDMRKTGILASLTAAQAHVESKKGNSGLTTKANNLFGIKGQYNGQFVKMLTTEYYNGVAYKVMADFRKYPSWAESIADHSAMFNRMERYKNLRGETDWKKATENVKKDGYATAPDYTETLRSRITKFRLYEWDQEVLGETPQNEPVNHNPYDEPTKLVKYGSRGNDVRWLQYSLNSHGYHLIVDGIFKDQTLNALEDFQQNAGLIPDGICGPLTREKLKS